MAQHQDRNDSGFVDKLVEVGRVAKVVKGGRRFSFTAIVVVGDEQGRVGWSKGKAKEVPDAVRKATDGAKRGMVRVPLRANRTIHHDVNGEFGASRVILKPAVPGTGIIAGGPMRAIFEAMGIKDVVAKSLGSNNPNNLIRATFDAFQNLETPRAIAAKRGIKVSDLTLYREQIAKEEDELKQAQEQAAAAKPKAEKKDDAKGKKAAPKKKAPAKKADSKKTEAKKAEPKVKAESKQEKLKETAKAAAKSEAKEAPAKKADAKADEAK